MSEPAFRYHPDPVATGSAVRAEHRCDVCGLQRDVRYHGPVYGRRPESLCLYCIKSGEASRALGDMAPREVAEALMVELPGLATPDVTDDEMVEVGAFFSDVVGVPADVPAAVVEEIVRRTPGFYGWQQPSWLFHCGDGAAFLGPAGYADLQPYPDALDMIRSDVRGHGWSADQADVLLRQLDRAGGPTAYLFCCLHCGTNLASWDVD